MQSLIPSLDTRPPQDEDKQRTTDSDDTLGNTLQKRWDEWSTSRREIEEQWLEDLRAFNQQNDTQDNQLSKFHSHIYMGITRTKDLSAYSRIVDLMFGSDDHWDIKPTPVPKNEANNPANQEYLDAMKARAELMRDEIADKMIDLRYEDRLKSAILEACIIGTGCVKGVIPGTKNIEKWGFGEGEWDIVKSEIPFPDIDSPSIFNLYPDPYANCEQDMSGIFERHILNRQQFAELKDNPKFDSTKIDYVITVAGEGNHVPLWHETERRSIAKIADTTASQAERFDLLEYWGQVSGKLLYVNGITDAEETETYWANVWVCHGYTLLARIMPMKKQRIPYNFFKYDKVPHQFWGVSPGRKARSSQLCINGVVRSMLDGMAMVAVPMAEVNVNMLKDGQDPRVMTPGQIYLRDKGDPAVQAVHFFQPDVPTGALMQMGEMFMSFADDESSLPRYTYGDTSAEMNKTKGGMAMQMNAAELPIKAVVKNLEDGIIHPLITSFFDWEMQWSDREEIKGDMEIDVLGTSALIAKQERAQNLMTFLNVTANPVDMQRVDRNYLLRETAKSMNIDPEKAVPDQMPENNMPEQAPDPVELAKAELIKAQIEKTQAETTNVRVEGMFSSISAGKEVAILPAIAPIADSIYQSAGGTDANGFPIAQAPEQAMPIESDVQQNTSPMFPPNPGVGMNQGIEGGM